MVDNSLLAMFDAAVRGQAGTPSSQLTLVNGLNSNIALPTTARVRIIGPTAAFSIDSITGGTDGRVLRVFNTTAFALTIVNQSGGSLATSRINTLTGANVVLAARTSFVTLSYDFDPVTPANSRWVIESTNGGAL